MTDRQQGPRRRVFRHQTPRAPAERNRENQKNAETFENYALLIFEDIAVQKVEKEQGRQLSAEERKAVVASLSGREALRTFISTQVSDAKKNELAKKIMGKEVRAEYEALVKSFLEEKIGIPSPELEEAAVPLNQKPESKTSLSRQEARALEHFFKSQIGILTQIAALHDNNDVRVSADKERIQERTDELYKKLIKRIPKELRQEYGERELRQQINSYITHYQNFLQQIKENVEIPTTKEGQENLLNTFINQLEVKPEQAIDSPDPLAAILQAEFRKSAQVGKLPVYPRGSGIMAQIEKTGGPVVLENAAGWVETSAISVGFMMVLKKIFPEAELILYPISLGCAVAISYGSNIPFKNKALKEVAATGKIIGSVIETIKENRLTATLLAVTVAGFITPAVDVAIERGLTSREVAQRVEEKLSPAREALRRAGNEFPNFVQNLRGQLRALVDVEAYPDRISEYQRQYPDMIFGESGEEGSGPIYNAKRRLFFGESPPGQQNVHMLHIVSQARTEAGLLSGESLPDSLDRLHTEFLEETEARRTRIAELVVQITRLNARVGSQSIAEIGFKGGVLGIAPTDPVEIERPRAELATLLAAQGNAYETMRTEALRRIEILTSASEELLPGSSLSVTLPAFSLLTHFRDFINVELSQEHPLIEDFSRQIAEVMHKDDLLQLTGEEREEALERYMEEYRQVAETMVGSIGATFSVGATFLIFLFRAFATLRRGKRVREQHSFHLNEARRAEEERIDDIHKFVNETLRKFFPSIPEVSRIRIRVALREFIAKKVVELEGNTDTGIRIKHWLLSNFFERSQNSEDTEALASVKKVLVGLQDDPQYVIELIDTLYPGYRQLTSGLEYDLDVLAQISSGGELTDEQIQRFKGRFESPEKYIDKLNAQRLEATYAGFARELGDTDLEYSALEHILADIKVGADTYGVFTVPSEVSAAENKGITEKINAKRYTWARAKGGVRLSHEISTEDQFVMRRVAEETEAAKIIIRMMRENRTRREEVAKRIGKLEEIFVTRELQATTPGTINIPKSVLGGEIKSIRDKLAAGTGMFEDVAGDVRKNLFISGVSQEDFNKQASYEVSDQLETMARSLLHSQQFGDFLYALNDGRSKEERLFVDLGIVYGTKLDKSLSEESINVPGFALRIRVLDKNKTEVGFEDFQMGKVLLTGKSPTDSAAIFFESKNGWARWAMLRLEGRFRKEWLQKHYAEGDQNKAQEGIFRASGDREKKDKEWLDKFYNKTVLAWAQAEKARELIRKKGQITQEELQLFMHPLQDFVNNDVPSRKEIERVIDLYYEKVQLRNIIDAIRATGVRLSGLTLDLSKWVVAKSSENKNKQTLPISEYR